MFKKLRARLRSNRGETLTEVLIALLVSSLALVMLALMVQSTNAIVQRSKDVMKKYMKANNVVVEKADSLPGGGSDDDSDDPESETGDEPGEVEDDSPAVSSSSGSVQFLAKSSSDAAGSEHLTKLTDDSGESISVVYFMNNTMPDEPVVSYKKGS